MDRRKRSDRESRELSASRAGKLRAGLEIQPDFQLSADLHLALDHFPPTAQSKGLLEKNICLHTHNYLPARVSPKLQGPRILRSPRTPAAASGAGFGGAQPPPIKPVPSTHSKRRGAKKKGRGAEHPSLQQRNPTSDIAHRPRACSRFVCSVWFGPLASSCRRNPSCFTILLIAFPGFSDAAVSWRYVWNPWHYRVPLIRSFGCPSLPPITFPFGQPQTSR